MNDPLEEIEIELRRLHPAKPDAALKERIEAELRESCPSRPQAVRQPGWFWWVPLGGVVALAIGGVLLRHPGLRPIPATSVHHPESIRRETSRPQLPGESTPAIVSQDHTNQSLKVPAAVTLAQFQQVNAANYLIDSADDGVVYGPGTTTLRKVRYQFLATSQWKGGKDNTTVEVIVPGEETVLVPMNVH
jgi:hypothetical protein